VTISVVCGTKNRTEHLGLALSTWCRCPEISEVVVVDWSSDEPVMFQDPKITMVRVTDQPYWVASKCHNLGLRLARGEFVLRLDADDLLEPGFFKRHPLDQSSGVFYYVDQTKIRNENEIHLAGVIYATRCDFLKVNGYNERIVTYGYEDDDLVARLRLHGVRARPLDFDTLHHIPHDERSRLVNQPIHEHPELVVKPACVSWTWDFHDLPGKSAQANEALAKSQPWKATDRMACFRVVSVPGGYWCEEMKTHESVVGGDLVYV
jgi:N-terminal domain of galactosyltransferase